MRSWLLILLLSLCFAEPLVALEITAVSPSTATPGATVTLGGGPFAKGDSVRIGERRIAARVISPTRLSFTLPVLPAGEYLLAVERDGERSSRPFLLRLVLPPPRIAFVSPATLDSCTLASTRQVSIGGRDFHPGAQLLLDNTVLAADKVEEGEMIFSLPAVAPGLHQVQVVNPDNQRSLPHGLFLSSTPEITTVQSGDDNVVDYELILQGKNFLFDSLLTVNGVAVGKSLGTPSADGSVRETMRYVDCTTVIYIRRPFLREAHELSLQIINPGGEQSNVYHLTTP